jgi:hypothetical protein
MPDWIINKINKLQKLIFTKLPNITIQLAKYDNCAYICHIRQNLENSNIFKGEDNEGGRKRIFPTGNITHMRKPGD